MKVKSGGQLLRPFDRDDSFTAVQMKFLNDKSLRRVNYLSFPVKNVKHEKPLIFRSNELGSFHE